MTDRTERERLKVAILDLIRTREHVSFAELSLDIPGFSAGDDWSGCSMSSSQHENVFFWTGMTREGARALLDLQREGRIYAHRSHVATYLIDGLTLPLDLAKAQRDYKEPRWYPVVWCTVYRGRPSRHRSASARSGLVRELPRVRKGSAGAGRGSPR